MSQIAQKQQEQQRQHQPQKKSSATDYDVLVLHIIEHKILSNPKFMSAWCRLLDGVVSPKDHKPIDLLVFLALYAVPAKKGLMEKMLKQKVRRRIVGEDLVAKTMSDHPLAVKRHLDELLLLVGDLGQSADSALAEFPSVLRKEAFLHLDRAAQTEILIDVVRKIGYGTNQRSSAILALTRLAEDLTEMTRGFGSILESVLDHVTEAEMEFSEVRQVLGVVSRLAYANRESGSYLRDHLQIMIKKQVWSMRPQVVKLGIIGTVAAVKNMTSEDEGQQQDGDTTASTSADVSTQSGGGYFRDAKEMLKRVLDKAERNGEVGGLLMDELTGAVESGALPLKLQRYIVNKLTSNFQDDYVVDLEDGKPKGLEGKDLIFGVTAAYGADDDDEIALNLASVVAPVAGRKSSKAAALLPTFGLLKASVAASKDGNLDEILALLGCPVVMPTPVGIERFEMLSRGEQNARCHCLFYCANWFRELLNAFADTEDQVRKDKMFLLQPSTSLSYQLSGNPRERAPPPQGHQPHPPGPQGVPGPYRRLLPAPGLPLLRRQRVEASQVQEGGGGGQEEGAFRRGGSHRRSGPLHQPNTDTERRRIPAKCHDPISRPGRQQRQLLLQPGSGPLQQLLPGAPAGGLLGPLLRAPRHRRGAFERGGAEQPSVPPAGAGLPPQGPPGKAVEEAQGEEVRLPRKAGNQGEPGGVLQPGQAACGGSGGEVCLLDRRLARQLGR